MKKKQQVFKSLITILIVFILLGYVVYPLLQLFFAAHPTSSTITAILQKQVLTACLNSILLSVASVAGSALIGTYFAYSFRYKRIWLKKVLSTVVLLPIAIPPITGVMSYLLLLGDNGLLMKLLNLKNYTFSGWKAILTIHLYSFYPLFYLFASNALKTIDSSVVEASHTLGAGKFKTFCKIILPQLKSSLLGASLLTFMASMASFSAPFIFGGSQRFLTTEIYYAKINGDTSFSALLSLLLVLISVAALLFSRFYNKKIPPIGKTKGTIKKNSLTTYSTFSYLTSAISMVFSIIIILPVISLVVISLIPDNAMMETGLNFRLSFKNYYSLFTDNDFLQPFINSLNTSFIAIIITLIVGLTVAYLIRGKQNTFKSALETIASIPYGIPGTVIAICLILSFNQPSIFSLNAVIIGSFWILPIAYAIRNLPIMTQAIKAGLHSVDNSIEEASNSLGSSHFKTWRLITLPLIYPSIIEGILLVFINSFGEFVATVLLYNFSTKTMPIEIYAQLRLYNSGMAATYGVVLFAIIIIIIFLTRRVVRK